VEINRLTALAKGPSATASEMSILAPSGLAPPWDVAMTHPLGRDDGEPAHGLLAGQARRHHPVHDLGAHPEPRRPRPGADDFQVLDGAPRVARRREETRKGDASRALDVIVEAPVPAAVLDWQGEITQQGTTT
jgi:hypothetical protein